GTNLLLLRLVRLPADNAPDQEKEEYARWKKADEMAKCYILAYFSNVLQHQHQSMNTAAEMLLNLKELFGHQSRAARQEAMRVLMNMTMREGTPVREHVLAMMAQLNELEVLGAFIYGETQVDIVLQSLPKSFKKFRLNYNMNKVLMTLPELVAELQAAEGLFRQKTQAMVAQRGEASTSKAPKGKKRKKSTGKGKAVMSDAQPRQKARKPKGKCYNYQQKGHWKANCPLPKKREEVGITARMSVISFKAEDAEGVVLPQNDALVTNAEVAGFDVKRVFIDTGSSVDVMFYN
ncbi:Unknown protein, partial [Striga hermonthica]